MLEMPPEKPIHNGKILKLSACLKNLLGKELVIISQGHPLTLDSSEPEPDIAVLKYRDEYYQDRHPSPDEVYLAIEIANTSVDFDKETKKQIYAKAGIIEYWVIDLNKRELIVHRSPNRDDYNSIEYLTTGSISLLAFTDVSISINKIF